MRCGRHRQHLDSPVAEFNQVISVQREVVSLGRWAGDRSLSLLTAVLFNATLSDIETGYKAIDRKVFDGLGLTSERFDFEPEITAKLLRSRQRIFEVPITYAGRKPDEGRKFTWRDGMAAGWTLLRLRVGMETKAPKEPAPPAD